MSFQATSYVIENSKTKGGTFLTLIMISNHCNAGGTGAWVGYGKLAEETRLSKRQVMNCVAELKRKGEISVEERAGPYSTNIYTITGMQERGGEIISLPNSLNYDHEPVDNSASPVDNSANDSEIISLGGEICDTQVVKPTSPKQYNKQNNNKGGVSSLPVDNIHYLSGHAKFPLLDDFKPSRQIVDRCKLSGCPPVTDDEVLKFILHHQDKNTLSSDWNKKFLQWMVTAKQFAMQGGKLGGKNKRMSDKEWEDEGRRIGVFARRGEHMRDLIVRIRAAQESNGEEK